MKRVVFFFGCIFCMLNNSFANPMFAKNTKNSLSVHLGQGTGQGDLGHLIAPWEWRFKPMTMAMLQYSQPVKILRLPARVNVSALQNIGYSSEDGTSFGAVGISWDIVFGQWCGFYVGAGIGPYMRDSGDKYVESRLVFGEKVFVGKNITDKIRTEIFTLHFSNGDFTELNRGFNFVGMSINYSF